LDENAVALVLVIDLSRLLSRLSCHAYLEHRAPARVAGGDLIPVAGARGDDEGVAVGVGENQRPMRERCGLTRAELEDPPLHGLLAGDG
jgi:hypothetical protein